MCAAIVLYALPLELNKERDQPFRIELKVRPLMVLFDWCATWFGPPPRPTCSYGSWSFTNDNRKKVWLGDTAGSKDESPRVKAYGVNEDQFNAAINALPVLFFLKT
jgi:hypothetical protein